MKLKSAEEFLNEMLERVSLLQASHLEKSKLKFPKPPSLDGWKDDPKWQEKMDACLNFDTTKAMKKCDEHFNAHLHYRRVLDDLFMICMRMPKSKKNP